MMQYHNFHKHSQSPLIRVLQVFNKLSFLFYAISSGVITTYYHLCLHTSGGSSTRPLLAVDPWANKPGRLARRAKWEWQLVP